MASEVGVWGDAAVRRIGEGLLDRSLPEPEWTHQAHLAATVYLLLERPGLDLDRLLPGIIWRYNAAVGTPNSDQRGYHETITRFYLAAVRAFLARVPPDGTGATVTRLARSSFGQRGFALRFWRPETLRSVEARRVWVEPDLRPLDLATCPLEPLAGGEAQWKPPRST